jgi:hypothetical protein
MLRVVFDSRVNFMTTYTNPLLRNNAFFANPKGPDLGNRLDNYSKWTEERQRQGYWPYCRVLGTSPLPEAKIAYLSGPLQMGVNLAVQDYLGLSTRDDIKEAATKAIRDFGVHSAGSPMLLGNNPLSLELEQKLSDFVQMEHVLLFPTGWAAGVWDHQGAYKRERSYCHGRISSRLLAGRRVFGHKKCS